MITLQKLLSYFKLFHAKAQELGLTALFESCNSWIRNHLALNGEKHKSFEELPGVSPEHPKPFEDLPAVFQEKLATLVAHLKSEDLSSLFSKPSSTTIPHKPYSFKPDLNLDLFSSSSSSNSIYSGYSDTGKGFYKVYGDIFSKVYAQELRFAKELGLELDTVAAPPSIGNLESPYSEVVAFYKYWSEFCSMIDFGWLDKYDVSIGSDRRARRAMEEENKKARRKAKKEYNEPVRRLAAFVKKRDKRVADMQERRKQEEEKRRAEEKAKEEERIYEEPEGSRVDNEEEETIEIGGFDELGENEKKKQEKGGGELYCMLCHKKFKSDMQWKNHEQSKKHKDKVLGGKDAGKKGKCS